MTPRHEAYWALCSGCQKEISVCGPVGRRVYRKHTKVTDVVCLGSGQSVPEERLVGGRNERGRK